MNKLGPWLKCTQRCCSVSHIQSCSIPGTWCASTWEYQAVLPESLLSQTGAVWHDDILGEGWGGGLGPQHQIRWTVEEVYTRDMNVQKKSYKRCHPHLLVWRVPLKGYVWILQPQRFPWQDSPVYLILTPSAPESTPEAAAGTCHAWVQSFWAQKKASYIWQHGFLDAMCPCKWQELQWALRQRQIAYLGHGRSKQVAL